METEHSKSQASRLEEHQSEVTTHSLDDLLAMASRYRGEGDLRQAEDIFWMLAQEHPGTPQAEVSKDRLRALAHRV